MSADVSANVIKITSTDSQKQVIALDESAELSEQLAVSLMKRGDAYKPRTEHFLSNGQPTYLNRLIQEDSPYLLQHAHNPVNWYSWGEEAFAKAKSADKPVFLSIGYATCHWCHVMERESFESEAIAAILNEHFIAIKVDREQRPDVDATYMSAVQLLTGRGGWPMSSFLTGDAKPFYGGTYFTPDAFTGLLEQIAGLWQSDRETINQHADELSAAVADNAKLAGDAKQVGLLEIEKAVEQIISSHDDFQGGFGAAPKFPQESKLFLLLQQALRTGDGAALQAAHYTLQRMNAGGIHDQVGGGFHRYAVDEDWLVPHFEKMLYNQAALTRNYLQAFLLTGDKQHERTLRRALDYVLREMTSAKGGFYSATDADSEGEEGRFFLWTPKQLTDVLGEADAKLAMSVWNVSEQGNFESRNILHLEGPIQDVSEFVGLSEQQLTQKLDTFSAKLLEARQPREQPLRDEKIITAWNGMMITAFAEAGSSLREQRYIDAALQAGEFLWQNNRLNDDSLWRAHFDGSSSISAAQEDYAFLAEGFVMLFDVTGDQQWLDRAKTLESTMSARFWDGVDGGYYLGDLIVGGAALPVRPKDLYDSATPTGNAAALRVLVRLYHRTGNEKYKTRAQELIVAFSSYLHQFPSAFSYLLASASELFAGETGHRQYAARGKVMADAYVQDGKLNIAIRMADGWHINANEPIQDYLIATRLQSVDGVDLESAQYPVAVTKQLGFDRSELSLFENDVQIQADLPVLDATDGRAVTAVSLQLQACNDEVCLAPENITLTVSLATDS